MLHSIQKFGVSALAGALILGGCSSQGIGSNANGFTPTPQTATRTAATRHPNWPRHTLYVADTGGYSSNSTSVNVYNLRGRLFRFIGDGVGMPRAIALDGNGNLYVANYGGGSSSSSSYGGDPSVTVYQPGNTYVSNTITRGVTGPVALAVNARNQLFVANASMSSSSSSSGGNVSVYQAGGTRRVRIISDGISDPMALAFDGSGRLYVLNGAASTSSSSSGSSSAASGSVSIYGGRGYRLQGQITTGIANARAMAVDAAGDVAIAEEANSSNSGSNGQVVEFTAGSTSPTATVAANAPVALTFDATGNLYVLNNGGSNSNSSSSSSAYGYGSVAEYAWGSTTASRTITAGINCPDALLVTANNRLYVANTDASSSSSSSSSSTNGDVTMYLPSSTSVSQVIRRDIGRPVALAFR